MALTPLASGSSLLPALSIADLDFIEGVTTTTTTIIPPTKGGKYVGYSLGGGVEYAFTRILLGRLQYNYDDF